MNQWVLFQPVYCGHWIEGNVSNVTISETLSCTSIWAVRVLSGRSMSQKPARWPTISWPQCCGAKYTTWHYKTLNGITNSLQGIAVPLHPKSSLTLSGILNLWGLAPVNLRGLTLTCLLGEKKRNGYHLMSTVITERWFRLGCHKNMFCRRKNAYKNHIIKFIWKGFFFF